MKKAYTGRSGYCCETFYVALCMSHLLWNKEKKQYYINSRHSGHRFMNIFNCPFCGCKTTRNARKDKEHSTDVEFEIWERVKKAKYN